MMDVLKAYASLIKLAMFGVLVLGVLIFYEGVPFLIDGRVDTQRKEAAAAETLIWTMKMAELRASGEKRRKEDQAIIDKAEADYLVEKGRANIALASLALVSRASPTKDNKCLPRETVRELNKVGRRQP